ncbi:MAG TPA: O-antigen ligase family protein [Pyrinomonadaceae bacterium]|jgi:O-antigen ligase/Tfp pilus assembly protein PilF
MNKTITLSKLRQKFPYFFLSLWSFVLLANFIPAIPQPEAIIGYLWKVEFVLAAFLAVAITFLLKLPKEKFFDFHKKEFFLVILPLVLFTVWSGFSILWAQSARNALHHTLLWACYCTFYLLMRELVRRPRALAASFRFTGVVLFILGVACIVEYVSTPEKINSFFTYRYYKYAEIAATMLPLFLALVFKTKSKTSVLAGFIAAIAWFIVLLSASRTLFISGFVVVGLFFALLFLFDGWKKHLKKSILLFGVLTICFFVSLINFSDSPEKSTIDRFGSGQQSQNSMNSRFLFWGIALESFKQKPVTGVGADNYVSVYKTARENYSALDTENKLLEINEDVLAERAHNEYLQILSELGLVGAFLFAWLLAGIVFLFFSLRKKSISLLSIASLAGSSAFLISSAASSYSFRVPANGLCFFFLLALAAKSLNSRVPSQRHEKGLDLGLWNLDLRLVFGLLICSSMLVFSGIRGASLMYLQFAFTSPDEAETERYFQKAIALDAGDGSLRYYYGAELFNRERAAEAIPQLRFAIDKGLATSIIYFQLVSAQIVARESAEAEQTFLESLRVYPRSVFLRTAYASFLKENGRASQSQIEFEKASSINAEQAKSWLIAHTEGMKKLTQAEVQDKTFVKAMELKPIDGVYALLDFQRQFNPNLVRR